MTLPDDHFDIETMLFIKGLAWLALLAVWFAILERLGRD